MFKQKGTINSIADTIVVSEKFSKRPFVIVTDGEYTQYLEFQFSQAKVDKLDKFKVGSKVEVTFNLKGRLWQDKCFNTLDAFEIVEDF